MGVVLLIVKTTTAADENPTDVARAEVFEFNSRRVHTLPASLFLRLSSWVTELIHHPSLSGIAHMLVSVI